jgi:lipopolysaccharide export system protein LptA
MARSKTFARPRVDFTLAAVVLSKAQWVIPVFVACLVAAKPSQTLGQTPASTGQFRITEKSADSLRTSILTGTDSVLVDGTLTLTDPRLVTVTDDGKTNLVFTASECFYDQDKKTIRSPGELSLSTGDGQMQLKGVGFSGNLAGPTLRVFGSVEARLDKKSRLPFGQAQQKTDTPSGEPELLQITSRQFELEPGQALFSGSVLVKDADGTLSSDSIAVGMREDDWEVQKIRAAGSVVLQAEQIKTTSEQADYDLLSGLIVLKGNPNWTMSERSGRANLLMVHRDSQTVNAEGDVYMKLPAGAKGEGGFLDFKGRKKEPSKAVEGRLLEIHSNIFLFQSPTEENIGFARYIGAVRVTRGDGQLQCSFLNVRLAKGGAESVNAEVGVKLAQGGDQLTAQTATYDLVQKTIQLRGEPKWKLGAQSGEARSVELSLDDGVFRASGRVKMQLPQPKGDGRFLLPAKTEPSGEPLLIVCDSFEYRQAEEAKGLDSATFTGNVVLSGDEGLRVLAQNVVVGTDPEGAGLVSLDASGDLDVSTTGENAMRYVADRLVYSTADETMRLTGKPSVEIRTRLEGSEVVALGQAAIYNLGTGLLRLTGDPVLKTAEGELRGREVVFNQRTKRLKATGRWKMTLNPKTIAKMFEGTKKQGEMRTGTR